MIFFFRKLLYLFLLKPSTRANNVQSNFKRMVTRFQTYSNQDISNLENARLQHLIMGGRESLLEPKVVNSFSVLYEDILPVRFGGDILFNMLDKAIVNVRYKKFGSNNDFSNEKNKLNTSMSKESKRVVKNILQYLLIDSQQQNQTSYCCDSLFSDIDQNKDNSLSKEEFQSWILSVPLSSAEISSIQKQQSSQMNSDILFQEIDTDNDGNISRQEFQSWTTLCLTSDETSASSVDCNINYADMSATTFSYDSRLEDIPLTSESNKKYRDRYLHMVKCFALWGDKYNDNQQNITTNTEKATFVTTNSESRIELVVDGCFAGAKNPGVVKALGILYEDYFPLRVAGDIVFKLVEKTIAREK